jgi:hypothetical protein
MRSLSIATSDGRQLYRSGNRVGRQGQGLRAAPRPAAGQRLGDGQYVNDVFARDGIERTTQSTVHAAR